MSQQKKKVAGLEALKNISIPEAESPKPEHKAEQKPTTIAKDKKVIFSLHLPAEAHEQLRELSFHERISMTKLLLEGVDALFQKRGLPSLDELKTQ